MTRNPGFAANTPEGPASESPLHALPPSPPGDEDFLPLSRPDIGIAEVEELLDSVRAGWVTTGPKVQLLEERLAEYLGARDVCCLSSCTAGLLLALKVAGVEPGAEVLVPTMTFVSCANVVEQLGATPVLVDCEPDTGLVDLDAVEAAVTPRTAAIIVVHLGGRPLDMRRVAAVRDRHGVPVVEDAAHAIGARWEGRAVGAHGNLASFSFHASKNMTTFEGGALVVPDAQDAERIRRLALHGLSRSSWSRHGRPGADAYDVLEPGYKLGMHDVAAAVGIHQLAKLDAVIEHRDDLCARYDAQLADLPLDLPPPVPAGARHARHIYAVRLGAEARMGRDEVMEGLRLAGIGTSVHFRPIHTFSYYAERCRLAPDDLPVANALSARSISLPLHPRMGFDDVDRVARALHPLIG